MFWYIVFTLLAAGFGWLIFGPSDNDGGDATMFIKAADPNRRSAAPKKKKFDPKTANVYTNEGKQILILYGTAYGFAERLGKKLYLKLKDDLPQNGVQYQPRLVNMKDYDDYIDLLQESVVLVIVSTAGDGVAPSDARAFVDYMADQARGKSPINNVQYSTLALGDTNYPHFCACGNELHEHFKTLGAKQLAPLQQIDKEDHNSINKWFEEVVSVIPQLKVPTRIDYLSSKQPHHLDDGSYNRNNPYSATMTTKTMLTKVIDKTDKEIIHCEFDLADSELTYVEGDALGILPQNNEQHVKTILKLLKADDGQQQVVVNDNDSTLYDALLSHCDLRVINTELLQLLYSSAKNAADKSSLQSAVDDPDKYTKGKEVLDILQQNASTAAQLIATQNLQAFIDSLKPLQPRYYSISSSPVVNKKTVSVTAGIIRYDINNRQGEGVCTTYLNDRLNVGQQAKIFMSINTDFRLPQDSSKPIVMIGPGTGLAPFRAFLQNRAATKATGQNVLYFGCRYSKRDYTYQDELEAYEKQQQLTLRLAFSRDTAQKVYVQHLLKQDSTMIWRLIQKGAHLYVCGDGGAMAKDVHNTLLEIVQEHTKVNQQQAETYLEKMVRENRYQKDVWLT